MTRIVVDASVLSKLGNLAEPVELCDASGQVVGRFFPAFAVSEFEPWEPPISDEELQRRENLTAWFTTAQVREHFKRLEKP